MNKTADTVQYAQHNLHLMSSEERRAQSYENPFLRSPSGWLLAHFSTDHKYKHRAWQDEPMPSDVVASSVERPSERKTAQRQTGQLKVL